jgi:hypothetical protein
MLQGATGFGCLKLLALTLVDCRGGSKINCDSCHNLISAMKDFASSDEIFI